jgi:hypothetical protein
MTPVLDAVVCPALPPRAWLLVVGAQARPRLMHGDAVDVVGGFFFEGAWDGPWGCRPPDDAVLFGTGGEVSPGRAVIYSSSYKLHAVYVVRDRDSWYVANSLPLVLAGAGASLSDRPWYYARHEVAMSLAWRAIATGLNRLPLRDSREVSLYSHSRVVIDGAGVRALRHDGLRLSPTATFDDYVATVTSCLKRILANACCADRQGAAAGSIAALSSGYDSTAVAVLARQAGCTEAVTLDAGVGDTGTAIGRALGLATRTIPLSRTEDLTELAAIFAMPGNTVHTPWFAMKSALRNRAVLTGWHGDTQWSPTRSCLFPGEFASRISRAGLPEARLWLNCVFVPIAAAGDADQDRLVALSASEEMAPYHVDTAYNRPLPRRIAAGAGVDHLLATHKIGSSACAVKTVPAAVSRAASPIRMGLALERAPAWAARAREQYGLAGWTWREYRQLRPERAIALEVRFRWAIAHLVGVYGRALGDTRPASVRRRPTFWPFKSLVGA